MNMKEAYLNKLQSRIDELGAEITKIKAKADQAEANVQLEYYNDIEELRSLQDDANSKLAKLKDTSDDVWEELVAGIDNAWDSIENTLNSINTRRK
jgi:uncharacterized coiled-coil DUF342 family protein